jgi:site-specific recombinase XerD
MLLSETVALFLDALLAEGRSQNTIRSYRTCLRSFMHYSGDVELVAIKADDIRAYLKDARQRRAKHTTNPHRRTVQEPLSRETIRTYFRHVRAFFSWCYWEELLDESPCERVRMPPKPDHPPKAVSPEDFKKLIEAAGSGGQMPERDLAIVLTLGDTGVRAGGLIGLTMNRLHLDEALIEVIEKGDKSRLVPMSPLAVEKVRAWLLLRPDRPEVPYVFTSYTGGQLTISGLYQLVRRIAKRAGVTGRSNPHGFRHFFGHQWVSSGGRLEVLQELLGHSQPSVTKLYYGRYDTKTLRHEHEKHSPLADEDLLVDL